MALVRGVTAALTALASIVQARGSMSISTGRAPVNRIAATVATKVNATVMTSSPGPTPQASRASCNADVPELTATA